jgi:small-conductance mechanosensitive channel
MKFFRTLAALLLIAAAAPAMAQIAGPPSAASAATPAATPETTPQVTPAQAQQTLEVLQDDKKRAQLIENLQTIAHALPPRAQASKSPAAASPPAPAAAATKPPLAPAGGLGRQLLAQVADWADRLTGQFGAAATAITDFPLLWRWIVHTFQDARARDWVLTTLWKLGVVLGGGLAIEFLLAWALRRPYRELERHAPAAGSEPGEVQRHDADHHNESEASPTASVLSSPRQTRLSGTWLVVRRLPFALGGLLLQLIPIAAFAVVANVLSAAIIIHSYGRTRLAIMAVVNAYVLLKSIMCITRMLASEEHPKLALAHMKPENAAYIEVWVRRIAVLALFGVALVEAAVELGLAPAAGQALFKLVALLVHLCFVIIVLQCRRSVAEALRAPENRRGPFAAFRNRLAGVWHYLAIILIMAFWVLWAVQVRNGLSEMLRFVIVTVIVLALARLVSVIALGSLDRVFHLQSAVALRYPGLEARANRYYPLLRGMISAAIWLATIVALLEGWGLGALSWFSHGRTGDRLVSALVTIGIAVVLAIAIWESANAALDRHIARLTREQQTVRIARVKTLLPILRNVLLITIIVILGLTILNQIGVNIGPLLAGAGIVGVAIGFGSQKLVQDLITGLFLLLENAMQVGDWVTAGGLSGSVETLSIRTVKLRAGDGSLHIIPFSAVTSVTNTNRGVGNAAVSVNVALKEDPDRVGEALKDIALEMRQDPKFASGMQSDLQLWGVDKVDASVMTIVGQIVCTDAGRWGVQREFNRRVRLRFQELGIEIANPTQTVVIGGRDIIQEPQSPAKTTKSEGDNEASDSTTTPDSPPPSALGHNE